MEMVLTVFQRWALIQAIGAVTGSVADVRLGMRALEALEWRAEERNEIKIEETQGGVRWEKEKTTQVELPEECLGLMRAAVQRWRGWPVSRGAELEELMGMLEEST